MTAPLPVIGRVTEPGVYDIPDTRYHADEVCVGPSLSSSIAKVLVEETPRHAWMAHPRLNPNHEPENRDIYDSGRVRHALMLGQHELIRVVDGFDDWRKTEAKAARDAARNAGVTPILAHKYAEAEAMVRAARAQIAAHDDFPTAFTNGRPEQTLVWFEGDGPNRIACRIRLDWLHDGKPNVFPDLKTTDGSAGEDWAKRTLFNTGADIQAAFYSRGIRAVLGIKHPIFVFVVVETAPPYALMMHTLAPEAMAGAEAKVDFAIQRWRWSMRTGAWPAFPARTNHVSAPPWEAAKVEEVKAQIWRAGDEPDPNAALEAWRDWQAPLKEVA